MLIGTRRGTLGAAVECGQRVWRPRSWQRTKSENVFRYRKLKGKDISGFAIGPLMFWLSNE